MSGQLADLSNPKNRSLTFVPSLTPPYSLPIMLPGVLGTVSSSAAGKYSVELTIGSIDLDLLSVDGHAAPGATVHLSSTTGPVTWSA